MKNYFLTLIITLIIAIPAFAQPDTLWTRTYGGIDNDCGRCVQQTTDGGYIIAGYTNSFGSSSYNVYLIKTDVNGNVIWHQTFGGTEDDKGYSVQQTSDGGYILTGSTHSFGTGFSSVWLIKTDNYGTEEWNQTYGGYSADYGREVKQTSDGGYIIIGMTDSYGARFSNAWLIKTDSQGIEEWNQVFGGNSNDEAMSVAQTSDGGYVITGYTYSYSAGNCEAFLIKTDDLGNQQWIRIFGGISEDRTYCIQETIDGGYIMVGKTAIDSNYADVWLIKTDELGNKLWSKTFGGDYLDYGYSVQQTTDTGYIIAGYTKYNSESNFDVYVIKTDVNGNELWAQTFGGSENDRGYSVQQTSDEGYIITGYTDTYGAPGDNVWLIRLDSEGTLVEDFGKNHPSAFTLYPPFPNPFNASTVIRFELQSTGLVNLTVFDVSGKEIARLVESEMNPGTHEIIFDGSGLSSGIYFAKLTAGEFTQTQKLVLMK